MTRAPRIIAILAAAIALHAPADAAADGPKFTRVRRTIETQPIAGAQVVYWDQALADRLGIRVPPGRPGMPAFDRAVAAKLAHELREGARYGEGDQPTQEMRDGGARFLYVEADSNGMAGRAGYLEAEPGAWVNLKGIGRTKAIGAAGSTLPVGPPSETYKDHQDGALTLEEAVKEAIMARAADAESRQGAARVLAIFHTGRTLAYPGGNRVPAALVVRAPLRRWDQGQQLRPAAVLDSLAQANASRFLKGDFVNASNMGAYGEFVDFGCMTHLCGFPNGMSAMGQGAMAEGSKVIWSPETYQRFLGQNLLMQLGIPERHVRELIPRFGQPNGGFQDLGRALSGLVRMQRAVNVDFEDVPRETLEGELKLHLWFRDLAANYLAASDEELPGFGRRELERLSRLAPDNHKTIASAERRELIDSLVPALAEIRKALPPGDRAGFAAGVRQIAHFKNRDVHSLVRPWLVPKTGEIVRRFAETRDAQGVQDFIENAVMDGRVGTAPVADSWLIARADSKSTELFVRRFDGPDGVSRLFQHPELPGAGAGEDFAFRVSTDGGTTHQDLAAAKVSTPVGDYFRISLPHGSMPVTRERVVLTPFVRGNGGSPRWLKPRFDLLGPPLTFNERLGLAPSFERHSDVMRAEFSTPIRILPEDLSSAGPGRSPHRISEAELRHSLQDIDDPNEAVRDSAIAFLEHHPDFKALPSAIGNQRQATVSEHQEEVRRILRAAGHDPSRLLTGHEGILVQGRLRAKDGLEPAHRAETLHLAETMFGPGTLKQPVRELLASLFKPGDPDAARSVDRLSRHPDTRARTEAVLALGAGWPGKLLPLIPELVKRNTRNQPALSELYRLAAEAGGAGQPRYDEMFREALLAHDASLRQVATRSLAKSGQPAAVQVMIDAYPSIGDPFARQQFIEAFRLVPAGARAKAWELLQLCARDPDHEVRVGALYFLMRDGTPVEPEARPRLVALLEEQIGADSERVREYSAAALARIGGEAAITPLLARLSVEREQTVRDRIFAALAGLDPKNPADRAAIARALAPDFLQFMIRRHDWKDASAKVGSWLDMGDAETQLAIVRSMRGRESFMDAGLTMLEETRLHRETLAELMEIQPEPHWRGLGHRLSRLITREDGRLGGCSAGDLHARLGATLDRIR